MIWVWSKPTKKFCRNWVNPIKTPTLN